MIVSAVISRPVQVSVLSNTYAVNMAALKAIDISEMAGNTQISVAGYYTPGDGGGGTFYYDSGSSATDNGGTIIAPDVGGGRWKRIHDGAVNVRGFGAKGDNETDDTAAIQAAIDAVSGGGLVEITNGTYKTSSTISVPEYVSLIGENRNSCVLYSSNSSAPVVTLLGQQSKVSRLFIRGGSVGVNDTSGSAYSSQITDNRIAYNRIGVLVVDGYIKLIKDNWICFNSWGVITTTQSFQVVIRDNVIDNNLGGGGVLAISNSGLVVSGNTIEGNRKEESPGGPSTGFGLWIVGSNQRTTVSENWFESNGNQDGCSDVIISRPSETWVDDLVTNCVPYEYASSFVTGAIVTGQIDVCGNFFLATKRGVTAKLTGSSICNMTINNSTFVGVKSKNNRPVELYGAGATTTEVSIYENCVTNTGDITIGAEMLTGIKASYVFQSGTVPGYGLVRLDGRDLFTAELTTKQFLSLSGATLDATSRYPSSGTTELKNGAVKAAAGTAGTRVVQGTGRPRAGSAAWFTVGQEYYLVILARGANSGATVQVDSGYVLKYVFDADGHFIIHQSFSPVGTEATLNTGDYYGWAIIPKATFEASSIRGCTRMVVTDLDVVERQIYSSVIPTSFSGASSYVWNLGDIVYNSAPTAGGTMGWVCTTAGTPGTWKTFGAISA